MEFYVIRHGQTVDNVARIIQGQLDGQLTEQGISQARITGQSLKKQDLNFRKYYVSDLGRTKHTFQMIAEPYDIIESNVYYNSALREHNFGDLNGVPCALVDDILRKLSPEEQYHWKPPNGECDADIEARCKDFMRNCYAEEISYKTENQEKNQDFEKYMIVSHCGWIHHMFELISNKITNRENLQENSMFNVKNCSVSRIKMFCKKTGTFCNQNCASLNYTNEKLNDIDCMDFLILSQSDISHLK